MIPASISEFYHAAIAYAQQEPITVAAFALLCLGLMIFLRALAVQLDPAPTGEMQAGRAWLGRWTDAFAGQLPTGVAGRRSLQRDLLRAGYFSPVACSNYQAARNVAALMAVFIAGGLIVYVGPERFSLVVGAAAAGLLVVAFVFAVPLLLLRARGDRRVARIESGLPDALDMVNLGVGGGLTVTDAIDETGQRIGDAHPELAQEMEFVLHQTRLGTLPLAFGQFAERTDSAEVGAWAAIVRDVEELGIDVTRANRDQADSIRQSLRHRADARASSAGIKLVLPFLFCLMPAVAILLWGPAFLQVRDFIATQTGDDGAFATSLTDIVDMQNDPINPSNAPRQRNNSGVIGQPYRLNR